MTTERRPQPSTSRGVVGGTDLKRIPLPPLPHFRKPDTTPAAKPADEAGAEDRRGPVSPLEMSELLGPDHEGGIVPAIESPMPDRTGTTGATIMNDLVDEIEKGLEKDLARAPIDAVGQVYRRVVACAGGPDRQTPSDVPQRRTDE
jgi:hypothetical protein